MAGSSRGKTIGCIGKCTSGLTLEEFDHITDNIHATVNHTQGKKIFRKYLEQGNRKTDLTCLDLYEKFNEYIDKERIYRMTVKSASIEPLLADVNLALNAIEELDDVPEIDLALLERYTEAIDSQSRDALINILRDTNTRLLNHLRQAHKGFRIYVVQPCPKT